MAIIHNLDFDPETHSYSIGGEPLPSVTEVLSKIGLVETRFFTEAGRDRGKRVHQECEIFDSYGGYHDTKNPYVVAWTHFRKETHFVPKEVEKPHWHQKHRYAGCPDRIGTTDKTDVIVEIKTGQYLPGYAVQLAAYAAFFDDPFRFNRWVVTLSPDGRYKIIDCPKAEFITDFSAFMSALTIYNWTKNHGG